MTSPVKKLHYCPWCAGWRTGETQPQGYYQTPTLCCSACGMTLSTSSDVVR